ncbi:MAG: DUF4870 domain-containing protein [Ferruginibacter sp.]
MATVTNIETSLSQRLKQSRRAKNFSQETLAEASGISLRTIQRIESGQSVGSAYTLDKLAIALDIDIAQLLPEQIVNPPEQPVNKENKLNLLNLSALTVILIPLSNIVLPLAILLRHKGNTELNLQGRKIINFQILWTLITTLLIILVPLLLLLFKPFQGGSIPLSIPVYYLCVIINVCFTLKFSVAINNHQQFLNRIPNIL